MVEQRSRRRDCERRLLAMVPPWVRTTATPRKALPVSAGRYWRRGGRPSIGAARCRDAVGWRCGAAPSRRLDPGRECPGRGLPGVDRDYFLEGLTETPLPDSHLVAFRCAPGRQPGPIHRGSVPLSTARTASRCNGEALAGRGSVCLASTPARVLRTSPPHPPASPAGWGGPSVLSADRGRSGIS